MTIHRLIGLNFIENPNNLACIDHIDRNRLNNSIENLRWASYRDNNINRISVINKKGTICEIKKVNGEIGYQARYVKDGKRISKTFKNKIDAEKYLLDIKNGIEMV